MARNVTLGTLVARCQRRADAEGETFISDDEWKNFISLMREEMAQDVSEAGCRYFEDTASIATDGTNDEFALPLDHAFTIGVDYVDASGQRWPLRESMVQERDMYTAVTLDRALRFALVGQKVRLSPKPPSGQTYEHVYVPRPADVSSSIDSTDVDTITVAGENFIVWGACVYAREKSDTDSRSAVAAREAARAKILDWAVKRSLIEPRRRIVTDDDYYGPIFPGDYYP